MNTQASDRRVALVTGGSGGIGASIVARLARDGYSIGVHYAGNRDRADEVVARAQAAGGRAIAVGGDVADGHAMEAAFDAVESAFGGLDVLINTAGVMRLSPIVDLDLVELDAMHRTNIRGTFVVNQLAAKRLRSGGAIVNFSSSVVALQMPTYGAYAASKGAVEAIGLILARELRGRNVTVNAVAPGPTATPLFLDGKDEDTIDHMAKQAPLERLGEPEDVANLVAFLVSPAGHWVNGQTIRDNGGIA